MRVSFWFTLAFAASTLVSVPSSFAADTNYAPEICRRLEYLEKYDLHELIYSHITQENCDFHKCNFAVLVDPEGFEHTVRRGNHIGNHFGVVKEIATEYIETEEVYQDDAGRWYTRTAILLREPGRPVTYPMSYEMSSLKKSLHLLGDIDESGKHLRDRLTLCRQMRGKDDERLACFDDAVWTFLSY